MFFTNFVEYLELVDSDTSGQVALKVLSLLFLKFYFNSNNHVSKTEEKIDITDS